MILLTFQYFPQVARTQSSRFQQRQLQVRIDSLFGWCCSMKFFLCLETKPDSAPLTTDVRLPSKYLEDHRKLLRSTEFVHLESACLPAIDPKTLFRITTPILLVQLVTSGRMQAEKISSEIGKVQSFFQHLFFFSILLWLPCAWLYLPFNRIHSLNTLSHDSNVISPTTIHHPTKTTAVALKLARYIPHDRQTKQ